MGKDEKEKVVQKNVRKQHIYTGMSWFAYAQKNTKEGTHQTEISLIAGDEGGNKYFSQFIFMFGIILVQCFFFN